jgi:hypothetical protein
LSGPADRQELPVQQIHPDRGDARPVYRGCAGLAGRFGSGVVPASAGHGDDLVFGDHDLRGRDVEDLPSRRAHLDGTGQRVAAPSADRWHVPHGHIRIIDLPQRYARLPRWTSRPASGAFPQRFRCRFRQTIRRRRL